MPISEALQITLDVARVLEGLGVSYLVCGSMASSVHGIPRATQDVDLVANLLEEHIPAFAEALGSAYYFDIERIRDAIRRKRSFNVIHIATAFKVDIFIQKDDVLSQSEMNRRERISVGETGGEELWVSSPEDTIVQKLYWYRLGGGVSEHQWQDALGILKVRSRNRELSIDYMVWGASVLGVEDLLQQALRDAGLDKPGE